MFCRRRHGLMRLVNEARFFKGRICSIGTKLHPAIEPMKRALLISSGHEDERSRYFKRGMPLPELMLKYQPLYRLAKQLGCDKVEGVIEANRFVFSALCPSKLIADQLWARVNQINPHLTDGDLTLHLSVQRSDSYGIYMVESGDSLTGIIQKISHGRLSCAQLIEANQELQSDLPKLEVGRQITIPNF